MQPVPTIYIAVIDAYEGGYGVHFPDLPGCTSGGDSEGEALRGASEALSLYFDEVDQQRPAPRTAREIMAQDNDVAEMVRNGTALIAAVPVIAPVGRSVRAGISFDAGILAAIDAAAKRRGVTRSAFLTSAALRQIESEAGSDVIST